MFQYLADSMANMVKGVEEYCDSGAQVLEMDRTLQLDSYSCGARSAFMILNYFGKAKSIANVERKLKTTEEGTSTERIFALLEKRGLEVVEMERAKLKDIRDAIDHGAPVLVTLHGMTHMAVVYGYSDGIIYVNDPDILASPLCGWNTQEFKSKWDRWCAVVFDGG